eukprot:5957478-Amphidinium_carterae.3
MDTHKGFASSQTVKAAFERALFMKLHILALDANLAKPIDPLKFGAQSSNGSSEAPIYRKSKGKDSMITERF